MYPKENFNEFATTASKECSEEIASVIKYAEGTEVGPQTLNSIRVSVLHRLYIALEEAYIKGVCDTKKTYRACLQAADEVAEGELRR